MIFTAFDMWKNLQPRRTGTASSYTKHSPAASIGWGMFFSAQWGR
jgi:hypothetical protein